MKNKVKTVVFPLTKNYSSHGHEQYNDNSLDVFYVSTPLDTLKKAATLARKHGLGIQANNDISVHPVMDSDFISPKTWSYSMEQVDMFIPELCTLINYKWLLEQVKIVEEGATYTESCLLQGTKLVVFNGETDDNMDIPTLLIKSLSETASTLLISKVKSIEDYTNSAWRYLFDLITGSEENQYKAELSDKAKKLLVDMKLQGIQNTTV